MLIVSFALWKLLSLMWSRLLIFAFVVCGFGVISKKALPVSEGFLLMFSSRHFLVSGLMFHSLIHFKFILWMVWDRFWFHFFFLHVFPQFCQQDFLNILWMFLAVLSNTSWANMPVFNSRPFNWFHWCILFFLNANTALF